MKQILVYADSLSWGIIPDTRERLAFDKRWPGVLENALNNSGESVRIIENCLNGRRTVWDDPFKEGRNGLIGIGQVIEMHSPLSLVVLMLGTNDFQSMHNYNAWHSAQGMNRLIHAIRSAPIEPGMPNPEILIVSPPPIQNPKGSIAPKFSGGEERCVGLSDELKKVAHLLGCYFYDSSEVISVSDVDGIHLDEVQHHILGSFIADKVAEFI